MTLRGSCLCGDIRFRIDGEIYRTSACHCTQCRKTSGHYWASLTTDQDELVLENGEASLAWYPDRTTERGFCVICGTPLFWRQIETNSQQVAVSLGSIDGKIMQSLDTHIYVKEKGDYYDIPSNTKQYTEDIE